MRRPSWSERASLYTASDLMDCQAGRRFWLEEELCERLRELQVRRDRHRRARLMDHQEGRQCSSGEHRNVAEFLLPFLGLPFARISDLDSYCAVGQVLAPTPYANSPTL